MANRDPVRSLRAAALALPGVEEGIACAGTALESCTFKARGKSFLFLRAQELRLKLDGSLAEASKAAARSGGACQVGAGGWVKVTFGAGAPPLEQLARWVGESHGLMAGAKPVAPRRAGKAAKPRRGATKR
jgi:hypothetical protein